MFGFFAGIFGYVLSFLYNLVNNYGIAIILFTVIIKLSMLPLSIKQQKTMKMNTKMQEEMKIIQFKYKNDPEKMNQEIMRMYKEKKMNPLSGCLGSILQIILILSMFWLVREPLTYMQKLPKETLTTYQNQLIEEGKSANKTAYPQIDIIREVNWLKEKNPEDTNLEKAELNMEFLGLDLNKIPQQNITDYTVYIIPVLYIVSSFISIRITTAMQEKNKKTKQEAIDISENEEEKSMEEVEEDPMAQTNKMMSWMMPVLSISIALVAPLGLALYWLINNVLMIGERLILDKVIKTEEE